MADSPYVIVIMDSLGRTWLLLNQKSNPMKETVIQAFISKEEATRNILEVLETWSFAQVREVFVVKVTNWTDKLARHILKDYTDFGPDMIVREVHPKILNKAVTTKIL